MGRPVTAARQALKRGGAAHSATIDASRRASSVRWEASPTYAQEIPIRFFRTQENVQRTLTNSVTALGVGLQAVNNSFDRIFPKDKAAWHAVRYSDYDGYDGGLERRDHGLGEAGGTGAVDDRGEVGSSSSSTSSSR